jgi:hypothetical protein
MSESSFELALGDHRPFFERSLRHAVKQGLIDQTRLAALEIEAAKGMVQIAKTFGSEYLRPEIEAARKRIVNLVSLYLLESSAGDLDVAARLLRDNTFLTLSRGGSGLLKALFALPEYAMLGREQKGRVEDFLEIWSLKDKPADYHNALQQRNNHALEIKAGIWFGEQIGVSLAALQEADIDAVAVIRSALLIRLSGQAKAALVNQVEFAQLLAAMRDEKPTGTQKTAKKTAKNAGNKEDNKAQKKSNTLAFDDVPEAFRAVAERVLQELFLHDMPKINDLKISLDQLVYELKDRYFIRDYELEDTSDYDALVSKEWTKITKGKTDIDSLLTLFLCLSVGVAAKTSLSEKAAKTLVKKMRDEGFQPELADAWIKQFAPHEKQESLLLDWHEFMQEAPNYLLDDWDSSYSGAMRFLRENCQIEAPAKK